ncbi:YciI family protein [Roseiterribacter gracilis]|uniref:YCII-related domain-containing protein n=1 Tax=Roseiterribacter gracilis TaxID=2812848 RepID=A0A8S8XHB5_9PROT|nr:hypothetical protein TMPK1_28320 [Rhodospirillales bacterium TMPK1]
MIVAPTTDGDDTMKYMLLAHADDTPFQAMSPAEMEKAVGEYYAYTMALEQAGILLAAERLRPAEDAAVVRVGPDGTPRVLDGPFIETKEQLGGFWMIEAANQDEAVRWATRCPGSRHGTMEVRAVWERS